MQQRSDGRAAADEAAIRALIEDQKMAIERRDAAAVVATYAADAIAFDLAPPLVTGPAQLRDTAAIEQWFATWNGPIGWELRELAVTVDGDVAFAHMLEKMYGTRKDDVETGLWFRTTIGLRREVGGWKIAHTHSSVPFYMDGSYRAAVDLHPDKSVLK